MRNRHSKCSHIESYTHIGFLQCQLTDRLYVELKATLQAVNCCTQHVVVANSNESLRLRSQGFWRGCWCGLTGHVRVTSVRNDSSFLPVWPTEVTFSDCQVKIVGEEQAQQSKCSHIESYTHIGFLQCQLTNRLYVELKAALQAVNAAHTCYSSL